MTATKKKCGEEICRLIVGRNSFDPNTKQETNQGAQMRCFVLAELIDSMKRWISADESTPCPFFPLLLPLLFSLDTDFFLSFCDPRLGMIRRKRAEKGDVRYSR